MSDGTVRKVVREWPATRTQTYKGVLPDNWEDMDEFDREEHVIDYFELVEDETIDADGGVTLTVEAAP